MQSRRQNMTKDILNNDLTESTSALPFNAFWFFLAFIAFIALSICVIFIIGKFFGFFICHVITKKRRLKEINNDRDSRCTDLSERHDTSPVSPLPDHITNQYKIISRPKGMCVIINNRDFSCPDLNRRDGTDEDVNKLKSSFLHWQFEIKILENQTDSDMLEELKRISSMDHQAYDCFVCFILSHGHQDFVYGTNGGSVSVAEIESFFIARQCRSLGNKPKLFFIQACQGDQTAHGVDVDSDHRGRWDCDVRAVYPVHEYADFLTVFATVPGHIAYRNASTGSPFISTLLDVISRHPGVSLTEIIIEVTNIMDNDLQLKQIPMFKSTLRKQVILNEQPCVIINM